MRGTIVVELIAELSDGVRLRLDLALTSASLQSLELTGCSGTVFLEAFLNEGAGGGGGRLWGLETLAIIF